MEAASPRPRARKYFYADFDHETLRDEGEAAVASFAAVVASRAGAHAPVAITNAIADAYSPWEQFYVRHSGTPFFHARGFMLEAFPELARPETRNVFEVGAGNGSNVFPILEGNPAARMFASDLCRASLHGIAAAASPALAARMQLFTWDAATGVAEALRATPAAARDGSGATGATAATPATAAGDASLAAPAEAAFPPIELSAGMDAALCTFILSAMPPERHVAALRHIRSVRRRPRSHELRTAGWRSLAILYTVLPVMPVSALLQTLRPGGMLAFRDYGLYDIAMLRAAPQNIITPRHHLRGDGTLAYYFE